MEPALCKLTDSGFLYEAELYPERVFAFRHPLTREVAYGTQLAERRAATHAAAARATIELNPDRHDELAALIAHHMEEGGETLEAARWSARAAYWAGSSQPVEAMRLWRDVTELAAELEEAEETTALAVISRLLAARLRLAPRDGPRGGTAAGRRGRGDRDPHRRPALRWPCCGWPPAPGRAWCRHTDEWIAAGSEATRLADESGDLHLRVAIRSRGVLPVSLRRRPRGLRADARRADRAGRGLERHGRRDRDRQPRRLGDDGRRARCARNTANSRRRRRWSRKRCERRPRPATRRRRAGSAEPRRC